MGVVNRYTKYNPAVFKPMSLQDLLVVPMAKQKKHDDQLAAQDLLLNDVNKLMGLQGEDDKYMTENTEKYRKQINDLTNEISSNGISRGGIDKFRNLYRDFQGQTSPTGKLGRIYNNFNREATEKQAYMKAAMSGKLPWSKDILEEKWKEHSNNFKTINEDGTFNQFSPFSAPKNLNLKDIILDAKNKLGQNSEKTQGVDYELQVLDGANGQQTIAVYDKVSKQTITNKEQVEALTGGVLQSLLTEGTPENDFVKFSGLSNDYVKSQINLYSKAIKSTATGEGNATTLQSLGSGKRSGSPTLPGGQHVGGGVVPVGLVDQPKDLGSKIEKVASANRSVILRSNGEYGFGSVPIKMFDMSSGEAMSMTPQLAKNILLDSEIVDREGGKVTVKDKDGKELHMHSTSEGLKLDGVFNGQKYNGVIQEPAINNIFHTYVGNSREKERNEYTIDHDIKMAKMNSLADQVKGHFPTLNPSEIHSAYAEAIGEQAYKFGTAFSFANGKNSYYQQDRGTNGILGTENNVGQIASRKVILYDGDGISLGGFKDVNELSKKLTGEEYATGSGKESVESRQRFHNILSNATSYGPDVTDTNMVNPRVYGVTKRDGTQIFFKVASDKTLSTNAAYPGMTDANRMQQYLNEGSYFVKDDPQTVHKEDGTTFTNHQYFIHYPQNIDGKMKIIPMLVNSSKNYKNLEEVINDIDMTTLQPNNDKETKVEQMADVNYRVRGTINTHYAKTPYQNTSIKQANEN